MPPPGLPEVGGLGLWPMTGEPEERVGQGVGDGPPRGGWGRLCVCAGPAPGASGEPRGIVCAGGSVPEGGEDKPPAGAGLLEGRRDSRRRGE